MHQELWAWELVRTQQKNEKRILKNFLINDFFKKGREINKFQAPPLAYVSPWCSAEGRVDTHMEGPPHPEWWSLPSSSSRQPALAADAQGCWLGLLVGFSFCRGLFLSLSLPWWCLSPSPQLLTLFSLLSFSPPPPLSHPSRTFTERLQLKQKWQFGSWADILVAAEALTIDRNPCLPYLLMCYVEKNKNHTTPTTPSWLPSSCPLLPQLGSPPTPSPPGSFPNPSRMAFKRAGWAFISCTELCSQQSLALAPPQVGSAFHASFQSGFGGSSPDAQPDLGNPLTCLLLRNVSFCSLVFPALFTSDSTWWTSPWKLGWESPACRTLHLLLVPHPLLYPFPEMQAPGSGATLLLCVVSPSPYLSPSQTGFPAICYSPDCSSPPTNGAKDELITCPPKTHANPYHHLHCLPPSDNVTALSIPKPSSHLPSLPAPTPTP